MKALLNLDAGSPFEIETPPVEKIPVEPLADLQPETVYTLALAALPQQKINSLRIQSAMKYVAAAKGRMYPTLSAFGGLGTNYVNVKRSRNLRQVLSGQPVHSSMWQAQIIVWLRHPSIQVGEKATSDRQPVQK